VLEAVLSGFGQHPPEMEAGKPAATPARLFLKG
jgi:hypothetical protein